MFNFLVLVTFMCTHVLCRMGAIPLCEVARSPASELIAQNANRADSNDNLK